MTEFAGNKLNFEKIMIDNMLADELPASDIDETNRERELTKLRCNSASPSTLSTASSGSPLVRGSSGSSHAPRRPAPTSIAAAQLQCQQQHLDFANKPSSSGKSQGSGKKLSGAKPSNNFKSAPLSDQEKSTAAPANNELKNSAKKTKDFYFADSSGGNNDKSPGYKMAKSIAFRAYRFNQFWSVNKIRYMNLACLFMTIACLATIIIYNWNQTSMASSAAGEATMTKQLGNRMRSTSLDNEALVEPIESLPDSSQALVSDAGKSPLNVPTFDDTQDGAAATTTPPGKKCTKCSNKPSKSRRKSDLPAIDGDEREIEEDQKKSLVTKEVERLLGDSIGGSSRAGRGFESLLKQIERIASANANSTGGSNGLSMLSVKPIRNKDGKTAGIVVSANIIENGTTRQLNDSTLSLPNFERLFPSILRPATLMSGSPLLSMLMGKHRHPSAFSHDEEPPSNGTSLSNGPVAATITIGGSGLMEPLPLLAPLASHLMRSFAPPGANFLGDSFLVGSGSGPRPSYMEHQPTGAGVFRTFSGPPPSIFGLSSPFSSLISAPPMLPPPALLNMLLRADGDESSEQTPLTGSGRITIKPSGATEATAVDPQTAASHQTTTVNTQQPPAESSSLAMKGNQLNDSEVEILDQSTLNRGGPFHNIYSRRPSQLGPSLIMNTGADLPGPATLGPFGLMAPPMVFVGNSRGPLGAHGPMPMNPMIRAILSNVMSEISNDLDQQQQQQQNGNKPNKTRRVFSMQPGNSEMDDEWEASERWDEQQQAGNINNNNNKKREMRARHRDLNSLEGDLNEAAADERSAAELMSGFQESTNEPQNDGIMMGLHGGAMIGGTIRQTIRGPGLSVERIIDIPTGRVHQQVGPGIKSQSLRQLENDGENRESNSNSANEQQQQQTSSQASNSVASVASTSNNKSPFLSSAANTLLFGPSSRPATIERLDEAPFPPPVGFIGRLLSDLSRRAAEHHSNHQSSQRRESSPQQQRSGGLHLAASSSLEEDLDAEGESEELSPRLTAGPAQPWPRLRLAGARIRMGPIIAAAESRAPPSFEGSQQQQQQPQEGFFLPPGHFAMSEVGPENSVGDVPQEFHHHNQQQQPRFEDTLNSMEDRLNHVLVMNGIKPDISDEVPQIPIAGRQTGAPSMQQMETNINSQPASSEQTTPLGTLATTKMPSSPPPKTSTPTKPVSATAQQQDNKQHQKTAVNTTNQKPAADLFTSPDSPLFGFPATSQQKQQRQPQQQVEKEIKASPSGNRQQRSFTYHSNNELASPFQQQQPQSIKPSDRQAEDTPISARARLLPMMGPPTGAIMGRRLDESFGEESNIEQQPQQQVAAVESRQQNSHVDSGNQNYWMWP